MLASLRKPTVLLIGRNGQIGSELEPLLSPIADLTALDRSQLDLQRTDAVRTTLRDRKPQIIINAAAYTAVDQAEADPEVAFCINAEAVRVIAEEARALGALFVQYSTDYVFDGTKPTPYVEADTPNPLGVYGRTKLAGEQQLHASGCSYLIFRTTWIYAATGKNFLRTILRLAQQKPELRIVSDQHGAPTLAADVARATVQVLSKLSTPARGLYHLSAAGETTWYGFAQEIVAELLRRRMKAPILTPITTEEYPTPARRPSNSVLDNQKLWNDFGVRMPPWSESLRGVLDRMDLSPG